MNILYSVLIGLGSTYALWVFYRAAVIAGCSKLETALTGAAGMAALIVVVQNKNLPD
jgi:hypothetical protein